MYLCISKKSIKLKFITKFNYSSCSNYMYETSVDIMRHNQIKKKQTPMKGLEVYT